MAIMKRAIFYPIAIAGFMASSPALAADKDGDSEVVTYQVVKGDTLYELSEQYFRKQSDYVRVQRLNKIRNPRRMQVGREIVIPFALLKFKDSTATLSAYRGRVSIAKNGGEIDASRGLSITEGTRLATERASFLTLELEDGSRVSMPSKSSLHVKRLRRIILTNSIDYEFAVENGATRTKVTPFEQKEDRFRMRTPIAVSAVRGTDFRTRWEVTNGTSFSEVVEGRVSISSPSADKKATSVTSVTAGNGASIDRAGKMTMVELLPAPKLIKVGAVQSEETLSFNIDPMAAAKAYRIQISGDAGFVDRIDDQAGTGPAFDFPSIENGIYFVKAAAVSEEGFEGIPAIFSFKRRLNTLSGEAEAGEDGYRFRWTGSGSGRKIYRFQLYLANIDGIPIVDQGNLTETAVSISNLTAGDYFWRAGVTQYQDDEADQKWTSFSKLTIAPEE